MLEDVKRTNGAAMMAGLVIAAAGIPLALWIKPLGIVTIIAGASVLMISWTISNFFFKMDMHNKVKGNKK